MPLVSLHLSLGKVSLYPRGQVCTTTSTKARSCCPGFRTRRAAFPRNTTRSAVDIRELSNIITSRELESGEQQHALEELGRALGEPLATIKNMAFRQKGLLALDAAQIKEHIEQVAKIVDVSYEKARQMCVIQPSLLTDTQRQAEALQYGLRIICHDLKAPKDEIVDLIIANPSLLHGRSMRLSVADMAHLALLREPRGRIVD
ncbi:hypothetical protein VOLCADRAFT_102853 [Volvox carteri f. nagariensis]|uniref:Uncharacterized protein n=1 Tax=Volvox carteri f. nagariensis TaxID=3068 RepID=D8TII2_VOLCA|nr:uncharacterized protein VOLCADRAFT_102853 [Volvox carteri f. nagariensis]EFJ53245.1 hypothetical protein VOLCADRAFT_102853 [Volvox carteri f. nagariensis]|eukprot:XP_002946250.1 hypothetical protein VOLCADRAFT_102853 [Volvox carteri f. nagariensis]